MRDHLEAELRRHGAALRALARDLVGAGDAEDVVQETALAALRTPPRAGGSLGGWLAGIVRHVAARHRRTERRRERREERARRTEAVAADARIDESDTLRSLTDAVLALPQPYRGVVFARYLKEMSPAAIAAQSGEPVDTIKTRLKRGLALLRERFDAGEQERGGDWRGAFVGAFGLERVAMKAAATAAIGGIVMTTGMKWALGVGAAALVAVGAFVWVGPEAAATDVAKESVRDPGIERVEVRALPAGGGALEELAMSSAVPTGGQRIAAPVADASQPAHVVRGRCVDEAGAPRAGVQVQLCTRDGGLNPRVAEWKAQHGVPAAVDMRSETGADGTFELRVASRSPLAFDLGLRARGLVPWERFWSELAIGTTDVGDVVMSLGTLLRGRIVDAEGTPQAQLEVRVEAVARTRGERRYRDSVDCASRADGSFVAQHGLPAGDYRIGVADHLVDRPVVVTLAGNPEQVVEVVLKRIADTDQIAGIVVDDEGMPVHGVSISPMLSGSFRITSTGVDGRFRMLRASGLPDRLPLMFTAPGYEIPHSMEEYAWGRKDVRIVATKGKALVVQVVRASDGTPVEDYTLRVLPIGGTHSSFDYEPRGGAHHAGGRTASKNVRAGPAHVVVEPADPELATAAMRIDVAASSSAPVVVKLEPVANRTVRVQYADESPVRAARVQLIDPLGETLSAQTKVRSPSDWMTFSGPKALVLTTATTDANGVATLRAPLDRALGLLLLGPGHMPIVVPHAAFPEERPLVITVARGATLRGTIGSVAAIAEIRRLAGIDATNEADSRDWPYVQLWRDAAGTREVFPEAREPCVMKPDGSFELAGVPPGRWRIVVMCPAEDRHLEEDGGFVELAEGETASRAIDLSAMLPGTIEGTVLHNGKPLASTRVQLMMPLADHPDRHSHHWEWATTDASGHFRVMVRTGEYQLRWGPVAEMWRSVTVTAAERARVEVGTATTQTFTLVTGEVAVRVVDAAGRPVRDVTLQCHEPGSRATNTLPPTDGEGHTRSIYAIAPFSLSVLPRRLQDAAAARAHADARSGQADPFADARIPLGNVTPRAGETVTLEIRLPADW